MATRINTWIYDATLTAMDVHIGDWIRVNGVPERVTNRFVSGRKVILVFSRRPVLAVDRQAVATVLVTEGHRLLKEPVYL